MMEITLNSFTFLAQAKYCVWRVFAVVVLELSCKLRTCDVCSSGGVLDICFMEMLIGVSLTSLDVVPDSGDISYICFPPREAAVGQTWNNSCVVILVIKQLLIHETKQNGLLSVLAHVALGVQWVEGRMAKQRADWEDLYFCLFETPKGLQRLIFSPSAKSCGIPFSSFS